VATWTVRDLGSDNLRSTVGAESSLHRARRSVLSGEMIHMCAEAAAFANGTWI
jgi:hypothetical protein